MRHARILAGASGLRVRVWLHYAAGGGEERYRCVDELLAFRLECTRHSLVKARAWLFDEELLLRDGDRIYVPKWAWEEA